MRRVSYLFSVFTLAAVLSVAACEDSSNSVTGPTPVDPDRDPTGAVAGED